MSDFVPITPDKKVLKKLITPGEGECPRPNEKVFIRHVGRLASTGEEFDSSAKNGKKFSFYVGKDVIDGLSSAVATMKQGEKAEFIIDPEYGYGEAGRPPTIPPSATLKFEIELVEIREKFSNAIEADRRAEQLKAQAGDLFHQGKFEEAKNLYKKAYHVVDDWCNKESQQLKQVLHRNLAVTFGKLQKWPSSLKHADSVLESEPGDVRCLLKKAESHLALGQLEQARQAIIKGNAITHNSAPFVALQKQLIEKEKPENSRQNEVFAKMFGK